MKPSGIFPRLLALLFLDGLHSSHLHAATTSGLMKSSETWSGTIELTGDVTVPRGVSLTVLPGTRIAAWDKVDDTAGGTNRSRIELIVDGGQLHAVGSPDHPIVFTSAPARPPAARGDWEGIRILGTNGVPSTLSYARVEFATHGVAIERGPVELSRLTIEDNLGSGLAIHDSATVSDSVFRRNFVGVYVASAYGVVSNCTIEGQIRSSDSFSRISGVTPGSGISARTSGVLRVLSSRLIRNQVGARVDGINGGTDVNGAQFRPLNSWALCRRCRGCSGCDGVSRDTCAVAG